MKGKNQYIGKSSSYLISSSLLLRGYNIAIPEVDVGVDIVAISTETNKQISIQVKSSQRQRIAKDAVSFSILIQESLLTQKTTDFIIFSTYMPEYLGGRTPHSRWWNIIFPWLEINKLCTGNHPCGSLTQNNGKPNRAIYFSYKRKSNTIITTRPGSQLTHHQDISSFCDGITGEVWERFFPVLKE